MRKKKRRQSQYLKAASLLAVTGVTTLLGEQVVQADEQTPADTGAVAESSAAGLIQTDSVEVVSAETAAAASLTEVAVEAPELTYSDSAAASSASGSLASTETAASKEAETSAFAAEAAEAPAAEAEAADSSAAAPETAGDVSAAETASRTAGITYRVAYRDAQTDELVHRVNQSAAVETTEERASTAITAAADLSAKALAGYQLAAGESAVKTQTIYERQSNSIDFRVEKTGETVTEAGVTTAGSSFRNSGTPYMTIERFGGTQPTYTLNGDTVQLVYKTGLTNIGVDDVELTPDAVALGLTYDPVGQYIRGAVPLDGSYAVGTYKIGLQTKSDQTILKSLDFAIQSHSGLGILIDTSGPIASGNYAISRGYKYSTTHETNQDAASQTYTISMPVSTFGYVVKQNQSIADVTATTSTYTNDFRVVAMDNRNTFANTLKLKSFTQTGGTEGVKLELVAADDSTANTHDYRTSPYKLRFTELPAKAGSYFVTFDLEDNLGLKKSYRLNITAYERSIGEGNAVSTLAITNADVKFTPAADYTISGTAHAVIPASSDEQTIGTVNLNKKNASVKVVSLPEGVEFDAATSTLKKKAGSQLASGFYSFEIRAVDGHFGDNSPNRTFTFEVVDNISPISHQIWKEGDIIPVLPITLESGTAIVSIAVKQDTDAHARLSVDTASKGLFGDAVQVTDQPQIATVLVGYMNNKGTTSYTQRTFTYEVQPNPAALDLEVSNATQTLVAGDAIVPIQISTSEGARLIIAAENLPEGLSYDENNQTISGNVAFEGTHQFIVRSEKDGQFAEKTVNLTVTPGKLAVADISITIPYRTAISRGFGLKLPKDSTVSWPMESYMDALGYDISLDNEITGQPSHPGTFQYTADISRKLATGEVQTTTATATIIVERPLVDVQVNVQEQTVDFGGPIQEVEISLKADGRIGHDVQWSGRGYEAFDYGLSVTERDGKYYLSGIPTQAGTLEIAFEAEDWAGGVRDREVVTIHVRPVAIDVMASLAEQTVDLLAPITEVEIAHDGGQDGSWNKLPSAKDLAGLTLTEREGKYYLSGNPNKIGTLTFTFGAAYNDEKGGASDQQVVTIHVNDIPRNLTIAENKQSVQVLGGITPIQLTATDGTVTSVDTSQLPNGIRYDAANKTFSGTPTKVGTYRIPVTVRTEGADETVPVTTDYVTITVTNLPVAVSVSEESQTVAVGSEITPIVVSHNPEAELSLRTAFGDLSEEQIVLYLQDEYGLTYDAATNTVSGLMKEKRDIRLRFVVKNPSEYGGLTEMATAVIRGVEENADLSLINDRQLVVLGRELRPIRLVYPEGVTVTVDEASLPNGVSYDAAARTISGTPQTAGSFDVTVTGEKGGKVLSRTAVIDVVDLGKTSIEIDPVDGTWIINGVDTNQSSRGNSGNTVTTAAADPAPTEGRDGDSHINSLTGDIFVKEDGAWVNKGNLKGAKGDKGDTGATGAQGEKGEQGAAGQNGQDGKDGESISIARTETDASGNTVIYFSNGQSVTVAKGDKGDTGSTGAQGEKGEQGVAGQDGKNGESISIARTETDASGNTVIYFSNGQSVTVAKGDKGDTGSTGAQGEKGEQGAAGQNGQDGKDGESISIARTETDASGNTVIYFNNGQSVTVAKGDKGEQGVAGQNGQDGKDGESISISRTETDASGNTVIYFNNGQSVTVAKGDTGATGAQGEKGEQGAAGQNGQDGKDGESISISRTDTDASGNTVIYFSNGQSVTVAKGDKGDTGATGAQGEKGEQGAAGQNGQDGKDGESISITRTETDASGNTVIYFSNGQSVTVAKGDKGDTGATGAQGEKGEQGAAGQNGHDGKDGESITIARTETDASGNTVIYFSNGQSVTVAKGDKGDTGVQGEKGEQGVAGQNGQDGKDGESISIARTETDASGNTVIYFSNGQSVTVAKGDKGDTGATGAQGEKGDKGDTGATGAQGEKGEQGAAGQNGQDGKDGESITIARTETDASGNTVIYFSNGQSVTVAKGDKGDTGATGAQGEKGEQGAAGQDGKDGESISIARTETDASGNTVIYFSNGQSVTVAKGDKGDTGATGAQGEKGEQGTAGQDGKDGESISIARTETDASGNTVIYFSNGQTVTVAKGDKGDTGATGAQGEKGEQGAAGQNGQDGKDGESLTIARTETDASGNTVIYFSNGQSVTVAKGDKGDTGATGAQGDKGEQGAAGQNGQDGKDGESIFISRTETDASGNTVIYFSNGQSVTVAKGDKGDTGAQGEKGEQGAAGQNGKDGESITIARTETDASGNTVIYFSNGQSVTVAKGDKGDKGDTGAQGEKGDKGDTGAQGPAGQDGQDGQDGKSISSSPTNPDAAAGQDGDTHINSTTGDVFQKTNGNWELIGNLKGPKGDKGDTGATGAQGEKGEKGDTGATGAQGEKGEKGDTGATGAQGEKGDKGDTGATGAQGEKGEKGDTGATGAQGEKGDKGDTGAQGPAGQDGKDGQDGKSIYSGNGAPSAVIGRDGDSYVDAVSGDVFLKSDGAWNHIGNIKGAKGDTGAQGEQGPAGQDGTDGTSVLSGTTAPTPQEGKNGDIYINAKTGEISRKENDVWVIVSGTDTLIDDSGNSNTGTADSTNTSGNTDAGSGSGSADPGTGSAAGSETAASETSSTGTSVSGDGSGSSSLTTGLDFPAGGQGASAVARASVSDLPFVDSQAFVRQANATLTNGNAGYSSARTAAADPQNAAALPSTGENSLSFAPLAGFTALLFGGTILRKRREDTDD